MTDFFWRRKRVEKQHPTVEDLRKQLHDVVEQLRKQYGERSAVLIAVGVPVGDGHDHFASLIKGPCLAERGLLMWAVESFNEQVQAHIDAYRKRP